MTNTPGGRYNVIPDDVDSMLIDSSYITTDPDEDYESIRDSMSHDPSLSTVLVKSLEPLPDTPNSRLPISLRKTPVLNADYEIITDKSRSRSRVRHVTWQAVVMVLQCVLIVVLVCVGCYLVWKVLTLSRSLIHSDAADGRANGAGNPCVPYTGIILHKIGSSFPHTDPEFSATMWEEIGYGGREGRGTNT